MRNSTIIRLFIGGLSLCLALAAPASQGLSPFSTATQIATAKKSNGFAASDFSIVGSVTGTPTSLTVKATLQVAPADAGLAGSIYAMTHISGLWFFKGAAGDWALWSGGAFPPPYFQGVLGNHTVDLFENMDLGAFPDAEFYVGYGLDEADMVANNKYQALNTKPTALLGMWQMTSVTGTFFESTPQSLYFDSNGTMAHYGDCSFAATYQVSGSTLATVVTVNDGSANCGSDDMPGTANNFTYTLSGDLLTLSANDPANSTATFQKSFTSSPVGTWNLLYTTDVDKFPLGNTFTLDENGYTKISDDLCTFDAVSTFGDANSVPRTWTITVVSNNGQCGLGDTPGSVKTGQFVVMDNMAYLWTNDGAMAVFIRVK